MTRTIYPEVERTGNDTLDITIIFNSLREIARLREIEDISDFNNLTQRFVRGRGRFEERAAPSSASDVLATDEEGDIVNDATYEYKLLNISGTLLWDRRALDTSW